MKKGEKMEKNIIELGTYRLAFVKWINQAGHF
jgi:hypothetical protein